MRVHPITFVAATCLLVGCDRSGRAPKAASGTPADTVEPRTATASAPVMLVDTTLPAARPGDAGWDYHKLATADLDGDGQPELASLIARVGRDERGFLWDDGQPWQLHIEEADGTRTYAYRRFVQLGTVEAHVATPAAGGSGLVILLVENTPSRIRMWEVTYAGPGKVTAVEQFTREIHPQHGFSVEHF
jgi:hypothetical protein